MKICRQFAITKAHILIQKQYVFQSELICKFNMGIILVKIGKKYSKLFIPISPNKEHTLNNHITQIKN